MDNSRSMAFRGTHAIAIIAALLAAVPANAQVDEIVVTARKRDEALQEVPVAVTAFSEEALLDRQIQSIDDVARFTSGLSFAKAFGRTTERPVIRGLGNVLAGVQFGVESGAAYFVDGVYYPGDLQSLNIRDVERIEVIRGPQSALYGRNTYSGAINFVTKSPTDAFAGEGGLRYGQDGEINLDLGLSGPIIDGVLSGSLSGRYYSFDGEYTNIVTGRKVGDEETRAASGVIDWQASDDLRIRSRLSLQQDDDGSRAFFLQSAELNNCFPGTRSMGFWNKVTGSTNMNQYFCGEIKRRGNTVALNDGPPAGILPVVAGIPDAGNTQAWTADVYNEAVPGLAFSGVERDLTYASVLAEWDIGGSGWTLSTSLAYRDEDRKTGSDSDHSSVNRIPAASPTNPSPYPECSFCASEADEARDYSVELRLESPADRRLRWMLGTFLYDQKVDGRDIRFADSGRTATLETGVIEIDEVENWAAFAMVEFDFTDTLSASIEGRYFEEEKRLFQDTNEVQTIGVAFDESIEFGLPTVFRTLRSLVVRPVQRPRD
jgi:outer membrane receptor protein involved in Fe transport